MTIAESIEHEYDGRGMQCNKVLLWNVFSENVSQHISDYTVPQYGDFPNDLRTTCHEDVILADMQRYLTRYKDGKRGADETTRDMLKLAHYASMLWCRRTGAQDVLASIIYQDEDNKKED